MAKSLTRTSPAADDDTEAQENTEADVTPAEATEAPTKQKQTRTPPQYLAEVVGDEFPQGDEFPRGSFGVGRESVYIKLMNQIAKENRDKVVLLVHFVTATSAQEVVHAFYGYTDSKGVFHDPTRTVPVGKLEDWTMKAIKVKNPETADGRPAHSELYVKYSGPEITE